MKTKIFIGIISVLIAAAVVVNVNAEDNRMVDNTKELFSSVQLFADAVTLISMDYVEPVNVKDLIYGAIKGMMSTLDDYSQFLDQESFKEITEDTKGEFGGIGIEVGIREGVLTVIAPIEDTPAERAGLEKDDKIIMIDGELTRGLKLDETVKMLKGNSGTKVVLTVYRKGEDELLKVRITRAIIKVKSIKDVEVVSDGISYINLVEFQERTAKDLRSAINKLLKKNITGIILDLRNNPGGLLNASVDVADLFLPQGTLIVYTEGRDKSKRMEFLSKKMSDFDGIDLVVLINKGSASASEILAGAIKDNGRGLVVGVTSFGKGSVQTVIPLKDKSALRLTTAAYYTPSGKNIRKKGIEPDIYVKRIRPDSKTGQGQKEDLFEKLDAEGKINLKAAEKKEKDKKDKDTDKKKDKNKDKKEDTEKEEHVLLEDNQIKAAFDILRGIQLHEQASQKEDIVGTEVPDAEGEERE